MGRYRILDEPYTLFRYKVERKGWLFWKRFDSADTLDKAKNIVSLDIDIRKTLKKGPIVVFDTNTPTEKISIKELYEEC